MADGSNVLTASRIELHLAGGVSSLNAMIGLSQRADITDNFNFIPVKGIGFAFTIDYVPGIYEGSGDLSTVRLRGTSLSSVGRAEHEGLIQQITDRGMELLVRAKNGDTIDQLRRVRINNGRTSIDVGNQILMEDAQIYFVREVESI